MNQKMAKYHTLFPGKNRNKSDNHLFLTDVSFDQFANRAANQGKWYFPFSVFLPEPYKANRNDSQNGFIHPAVILNDISEKPQIISGHSQARRKNKMTEGEEKLIKTGNSPERRQTSLNVFQYTEFITLKTI